MGCGPLTLILQTHLSLSEGAYDGAREGPRTEPCFRVLSPTIFLPNDFSFLNFEE